MCLAAIAINLHSKYKLVCIANRDEFHNRPALPMQWWEDQNTLAGIDLQANGTWMGLNKQGRFALVTNVRNPALSAENTAPSRGRLVIDYLTQATLPSQKHRREMATYNLLTGDLKTNVWQYQTNQFEKANHQPSTEQELDDGLYGLSNASLDTPWPKTIALTLKLQTELIENKNLNRNRLFEMLGDTAEAADKDLPSTGVPYEWEKKLSAIKIVSPSYGTRCSTVLTVDHRNQIYIQEKSFNPEGKEVENRAFEFTLPG